MRCTCLLADAIFLLPSSILLFNYMAKSLSIKSNNKLLYIALLLVLLLKPDQILIDHGHFQYNSVPLGCILYALYFLLNRNTYVCCVFYTLAVNCKQMSIYYGLAFVFGLIGLSFRDNHFYRAKNKRYRVIKDIMVYAFIVIGITAIRTCVLVHLLY